MSKSSIERRADLQAALAQFKTKRETVTLQELADLWGVSKPRFINLRAQIRDFPDDVGKDGNALLYQAKPAIEALLRYETRNDQATAAKATKIARILGSPAPEQEGALPASEMLALARARGEIQKQLQDQGLLVKASEVQEIVGEVFGILSSTLGTLSDSVDPNGKLPGPTRSLLDQLGKDLLLRTYRHLDKVLGDVDGDTGSAAPARARPARPRRPKAHRKRA